MRRIDGYSLWLGHVGDIQDLSSVLNNDISVVVDLAINEPIPQLTRELVYIRCPLNDGAGNDPWALRLAVRTVATLLNENVATLVYCSAGMSRTPAIAAAALASAHGLTLPAAIMLVTQDAPSDISPALIGDLQAIFA